MTDTVAVTIDVDWAPDFAIDATAALLESAAAPATWFVTHLSPAVERLRRNPRFELGIHPNFLSGSTHGSSAPEVLRHCCEMVPDTVSMRAHSLVQSTPLFHLVTATTAIRFDATLLLPRLGGLRPFEQRFGGHPLVRVPYVWEDDVEMEEAHPDWDPAPILALEGLRVFNVHPIHVFLNSADMQPYQSLKQRGLDRVAESDARAFVHQGNGTRTMLEVLLRTGAPHTMKRIRDMGGMS
jgi:hypothetical protein